MSSIQETKIHIQDDYSNREKDHETTERLLHSSAEATKMSLNPSQSKTEKKFNPALIIAVWIALSSSVIIYNKYILTDLDFPFPIFLTTFHLVFATIGTRILARTTHLLDGLANVQMTYGLWLKSILPIGALFSASLIFSNLAYLSLSVSFIQMLKAFTSVAVLGMSVLFGLESPTSRTLIIVVAISAGVALASYGEIDFSWTGFTYQACGILFEAARLVSIQKLLHGMKMDPLVSLYYFAPVCAALNACLIPFYEGWAPVDLVFDRLGPVVLLSNASCAFGLNVTVVFLIGCASSLVLTLSGVLKDILLVVGSVVLLGSTVTPTQLVGYSIALVGLMVFKTKQEVVDDLIRKARASLRL